MWQRIVPVSAVAGCGLAAYVAGAPLDVALTAPVGSTVILPSAALVLVACLGMVLLGAMDLSPVRGRERLAAAAPPALFVLGSFWLVRWLPGDARVLAAAALFGAALGVILWATAAAPEAEAESPGASLRRQAATIVAAGVFFTGILGQQLAPLAGAAIAAAGAGLLALALWQSPRHGVSGSDGAASGGRPAAAASSLFAGPLVAGVTIGEAALALAYWPTAAVLGGLALAALFYAVTGMMDVQQRRQADLPAAAEYALAGTAALALVVVVILRGS
jgi:hypothetical protein